MILIDFEQLPRRYLSRLRESSIVALTGEDTIMAAQAMNFDVAESDDGDEAPLSEAWCVCSSAKTTKTEKDSPAWRCCIHWDAVSQHRTSTESAFVLSDPPPLVLLISL